MKSLMVRSGAGQGLQCLVGIGIALPAEYGLDALGHDLPVVGEIPLDGVLVEYQFVQALLEGFQGYDSMGDGNAYIAQGGGVRQVPLQARYGQLGC